MWFEKDFLLVAPKLIEGIEFILVTCIKLPIFECFAVSKLSFRIFKLSFVAFKLSFGIFGKLSNGQNAQK